MRARFFGDGAGGVLRADEVGVRLALQTSQVELLQEIKEGDYQYVHSIAIDKLCVGQNVAKMTRGIRPGKTLQFAETLTEDRYRMAR